MLAHTQQHQPQAAQEVLVPGVVDALTDESELFPVAQELSLITINAVETAINAELDELIYDINHDNKVSGNFMVGNPDKENCLLLLEDPEDEAGGNEYGADNDDEGNKADLHSIALAHRIINDDKCVECFTKLAAERIVLFASMGAFGVVEELLV